MLLVTGTKDDSESDFPSEVDKEEWEEEQKVQLFPGVFIALTLIFKNLNMLLCRAQRFLQ